MRRTDVQNNCCVLQVDALQHLVDNDVFSALEERVGEVLAMLEQRVVELERRAGGEASGECY